MNLRKEPAFELFNMDKPDPYNEKMIFRTWEIADRMRKRCGGEIRHTFVHIQEGN